MHSDAVAKYARAQARMDAKRDRASARSLVTVCMAENASLVPDAVLPLTAAPFRIMTIG